MEAVKYPRAGSLSAIVLAYVCEEPRRWTTESLAEELGSPYNSIRHAIKSLRRQGKLTSPGRGHRLLEPTEPALVWHRDQL